MLVMAGLGLYDELDVTLKTVEFAKKVDKIYAEFYTAILTGTTIEKIEKTLQKEITVLNREKVEYETNKLIEEAKEKDIMFLTAGDPMVATTHVDIAVEARKKGIEVIILNAPSIYSAIGITGLQLYKFGKTTSIVFPEPNYFPETPYDVIKDNLSLGYHTLCLLDIQTDKQKFMTANEGLSVLLEIEEKRKEKIIDENTKVLVVARAGSIKPGLFYGKIKDLIKHDFGTPLHCVIILGKLHFMETDALKYLFENI
ncbi:diphthine synthase [Methanococcus vannielii SB]|jgi:diphthine synthase|uniref:Diphthine synthase n=1 Tax=Methanococcus vannielii (strain ATCC 35089 / DSM 1224 / JCM 13029 / OCM 148 / SB) TaxID=406327 RepID=DPHB_METVS|nr:diphthine synthase [Methanococcus vannielii]A6US81.1 RecName: Full=Diphthine synthase; AltName: Full=Diphthamide biosynthesis methyltransferase [Methanococcus vannielii SB]ABR55353.1 diphthine synthase [Methanococcus vannielii SB]